ncbi:hypothetical protein [Psychrobacter phenylpyruvicus]|nr:hypothetical protein [Psychrobacter phenylpyruvicus]SUD98870.1 Uncharacterised protein [Psychrobacter phenylpyruvicus]
MQTNFSQPQTFNPADMSRNIIDNDQDPMVDSLDNEDENSAPESLDEQNVEHKG